MLIGHLPAGYFLTRYLIKKNKLPLNIWWLGLGLIASILPDFDIAYIVFHDTTVSSHRNYFTDYPFFYLLAFLMALLVYFFNKKKWLIKGIYLIFANVLLHFLLDTPFVGIKWLWPVYNKFIGIYNAGFTGGFLVGNYFTHWYWYLEIALWLAAITAVIISYKKGELKN
ncbi:MAG: metal-dependent hydrolase [Candidatus Komeilibacteria bacterium]|nr:metal-dependent hydrolase [Candidatus Komeilibacteria bacterium]